jgi:hypothetical protein
MATSTLPSPASRMHALCTARTCYDHLAGRLGVAVFDALLNRAALCPIDPPPGALRKVRSGLGPVFPGAAAADVFASLGVQIEKISRRPLATACLDWTETRPHLAGALGAALCTAFLNQAWVVRHAGFRALKITQSGRQALASHLDMQLLTD